MVDPVGVVRLGLCRLLLFSGTSTSTPAYAVVINDHHADFTIAADGALTAVETVTGEFSFVRHAIFRCWDAYIPFAVATDSGAVIATIPRMFVAPICGVSECEYYPVPK